MKFRIPKLDIFVWVAIGAAALMAGAFFVWLVSGRTITVTNGPSERKQVVGLLTGESCTGARKRPVAVMLASDPEARPLSGIGEADAVFEMPVTPNGITRLMAVYQCGTPDEIGSIRSARGPFIPLVRGMDAIFAHWGGERDALELLDGGATDNVDALKYEGTTYYRKRGVPRPHNGFTTLDAVRERADELGYAATASAPFLTRSKDRAARNLTAVAEEIRVDWPQDMDVTFRYDSQSGKYRRWRGGKPEIDALTGDQVEVAAVIVMHSDATFLYDQYLDVRVIGTGRADIYQGGRRSEATWRKPSADAPLTLTDAKGDAVPLAPGTLWFLIDAPL